MKKTILALLILTVASYSKEVCNFINMNTISSLYIKKTKELKLFKLPYADDSMICKRIPNSNKVITVTTYKGKDGDEDLEDVYLLSLVIAIVNSNTGEILQSHFHKDIATSDAVEVETLTIDTTTYSDLSKYKPFGITIAQGVHATHGHAMSQHHFFLFEARENEIKTLVDNFDFGGHSMMCENYRVCSGENVTFQSLVTCKRHDYCPIMVKTYVSPYYLLPITDDEASIEAINTLPSFRKLVFKNGKYSEVKVADNKNVEKELTFTEVEKGAKNGKSYTRYELAKLIYQPLYVEGEFKKVRQLNDIAYYLQKSGHNLQAIMLLEILIKEFPKRTVAYYNLADAYWGLGRKEEAKKMYEVYVKQMRSKGKEKRIPKMILERLK